MTISILFLFVARLFASSPEYLGQVIEAECFVKKNGSPEGLNSSQLRLLKQCAGDKARLKTFVQNQFIQGSKDVDYLNGECLKSIPISRSGTSKQKISCSDKAKRVVHSHHKSIDIKVSDSKKLVVDLESLDMPPELRNSLIGSVSTIGNVHSYTLLEPFEKRICQRAFDGIIRFAKKHIPKEKLPIKFMPDGQIYFGSGEKALTILESGDPRVARSLNIKPHKYTRIKTPYGKYHYISHGTKSGLELRDIEEHKCIEEKIVSTSEDDFKSRNSTDVQLSIINKLIPDVMDVLNKGNSHFLKDPMITECGAVLTKTYSNITTGASLPPYRGVSSLARMVDGLTGSGAKRKRGFASEK